MFKLESVSKKYDQQQILSDINFSIGKKEFISIIGKSGVGKTTLLSVLAGLVKPDSGKIIYNDADISSYDEEQWAKFRLMNIGIVFQDFKIIPSLSVYDNVFMALYPRTDISPDDKRKMVDMVVSQVELGHKLKQVVDSLSGGEKQRVAIARSLVGKPKLILADEPTGNLDEETSKNILDLFNKLHQELSTSLIMITHDNDIAKKAEKTYKLTNKTLKKI